MKSLADGLPPEIAEKIHADWRKNEVAYWAVRDQLLHQYQGQWVGFADGVVVASGTRPVVVFHAAHQAAEHPYIACVGRETEPYGMRRTNFRYDTSYPGEALPVIRAEFRRNSGVPGLVLDQVGRGTRPITHFDAYTAASCVVIGIVTEAMFPILRAEWSADTEEGIMRRCEGVKCHEHRGEDRIP